MGITQLLTEHIMRGSIATLTHSISIVMLPDNYVVLCVDIAKYKEIPYSVNNRAYLAGCGSSKVIACLQLQNAYPAS